MTDDIWPPPPDTEPPPPPVPQTSLQRLRAWMFSVPDGKRSAWEIIKWWELRRLAYNGIMFCVGIVSYPLLLIFADRAGTLKPSEDPVEPMLVIVAPFVMNFAYTAGWVVECVLNWISPTGTGRTGPTLLSMGLVFSLFIIVAPTVLWGLTCLVHLFSGK